MLPVSTLPISSPAELQQAYPQLTDTIASIAWPVCEQAFKEIEFFNQQLNQHKLEPASWSVELQLNSESKWQNNIIKQHDKPAFRLDTSLCQPVQLLSVAMELDYLTQCAREGKIAKSGLSQSSTSLDNWCQAGTVTDEAIQLTLDSFLLLYLHQVSQVMFGHASLTEATQQEATLQEKRALTTDADFNAGSMFVLWLSHHPDANRKPADEQAALKRLIQAAWLLAVVQKSQTPNKNALHLAANRVECMLNSALATFEAMSTKVNADEDWLDEASGWIQAALSDSSLANAAGSESEIQADAKQLETVSAPLREKLKAGPLSELMFAG